MLTMRVTMDTTKHKHTHEQTAGNNLEASCFLGIYAFMFELKENKEQRNQNAFLISLRHNFLCKMYLVKFKHRDCVSHLIDFTETSSQTQILSSFT